VFGYPNGHHPVTAGEGTCLRLMTPTRLSHSALHDQLQGQPKQGVLGFHLWMFMILHLATIERSVGLGVCGQCPQACGFFATCIW
jgi:hypothetical protein